MFLVWINLMPTYDAYSLLLMIIITIEPLRTDKRTLVFCSEHPLAVKIPEL